MKITGTKASSTLKDRKLVTGTASLHPQNNNEACSKYAPEKTVNDYVGADGTEQSVGRRLSAPARDVIALTTPGPPQWPFSEGADASVQLSASPLVPRSLTPPARDTYFLRIR